MAELPGCNDGPVELLKKILLQFLSMATNPPKSLNPSYRDSEKDLYRKILITLQYL